MKDKALNFLNQPIHIAPLAVFRIVFGAILFISILRFMLNDWVHELYVEPKLFFPYYGFEWIKPLPEAMMYLLFGALAVSFLLQCIGLFYKGASVFSFLSFTYIELIDKTNYLNHYYFVSIVCFLLIFVPAHRYCSIDVIRKPQLKRTQVPRYFVLLFQLQLGIVYFYAGIAKLNYDWLVNALPLKIWLPSKSNLPLIGPLLTYKWLAYAFSWFGALYDLLIPFFLLYTRSRPIAYFFVIVFHVATYLLFQIGMFPFIMIGATLIFFSEKFHLQLIARFSKKKKLQNDSILNTVYTPKVKLKTSVLLLSIFFMYQLLTPFRYSLYPDNLYWTEEGYRFSWRVMLMEKAGYAIFHIHNPENNRHWEVNNYEFLTPNQEKMMSTQPDMILQFAHFLERHYQQEGISHPKVTAEVYVSLNGRRSQLFIDPSVDLTQIKEGFAHKEWILPLKKTTNND